MALVSPQVGQACAQQLAPGDRAAIVAHMACIGGLGHVGQQVLHHGRRPTKAIASQQHRITTDALGLPVGPHETYAVDALVRIGPQLGHLRLRQNHHACSIGCGLQAAHQTRAGFFGYGMHAVGAVAGVQKVVEHLPGQSVVNRQGVHRWADVLRIGLHQMRRGLPVRLGLDVGSKGLNAVGDALRLLRQGTRRRDEAGRQSRGTRCKRITLQHHALNTPSVQGQRRCQAASACAHDDQGRVIPGLHVSWKFVSRANLRQWRVHGFSLRASKKWRCPSPRPPKPCRPAPPGARLR